MGGTFDPIHYGHLATAEAVRYRFKVDKVIFMPTGNPAHKSDRYVTHHEHRYLMTVLATMRNENFDVSRIEIERPGITYTIDTIQTLKKMCPPDARLYFITGADALHQIFTWKEPEKLLKMCDFVAVTRSGYDKNKLFDDRLGQRHHIAACLSHRRRSHHEQSKHRQNQRTEMDDHVVAIRHPQ